MEITLRPLTPLVLSTLKRRSPRVDWSCILNQAHRTTLLLDPATTLTTTTTTTAATSLVDLGHKVARAQPGLDMVGPEEWRWRAG